MLHQHGFCWEPRVSSSLLLFKQVKYSDMDNLFRGCWASEQLGFSVWVDIRGRAVQVPPGVRGAKVPRRRKFALTRTNSMYIMKLRVNDICDTGVVVTSCLRHDNNAAPTAVIHERETALLVYLRQAFRTD